MQMSGRISNPKQGIPSFVKIIFDPSKPYLALPYMFVEDLENKIHRNYKLKTETGERSWDVKIKVIKESYCFVDGWRKVAKDVKLGFGDTLMFWLIDDSTFQISVYSSDGYEKELSSNFTDFCDCSGKTKRTSNVKNVTKISDEDDGLLDVMEISDGDDCADTESEEEEGDDCEEDEDDGEGDEEHLSYSKVITKGHKHQLCIPVKFARRNGLAGKDSVEVKDLKGKEWLLGINHLDSRSHYFTTSWPAFRKKNRIADGDTCFFTFNKSENKLVLTKLVKGAR